MTCSANNAKSTAESGTKLIQDKRTEPRILPYYCSWYRSIFPRKTTGSGSENEGKFQGQVPG